MERRLTSRIREHETAFKNNIQKWLSDNNCNITDSDGDKRTSEFLQFVYDYSQINITSADFIRRKRVKNDAPYYERCTANRADGHQCTRRKRDGSMFCGTHMKGTPHGVIATEKTSTEQVEKIEIWVEDINGINYHIDSHGNVYDPKDIINGIKNPNIIAQYQKNSAGVFSIPSLSS